MVNAPTLSAARVLWDYHCLREGVEVCDVIVGLGSYDLRVADRVADLFHEGIAPEIIFTGRSGHWTEGRYTTSEAAAFADRAIERGVPASAIELEERARNMGENLAFTAPLVAPRARVLFVTKPHTQRRCRAAALRQWPAASSERLRVGAPLTPFDEQPTAEFPLPRLIDEMVGDLWRILEYPRLGFQVPQTVPEEVIAAFRMLVERGYDGHIPN